MALITLPSEPVQREITISPRWADTITRSPYSFKQQVQSHTGEGWEAHVKLPSMNRAEAEPWIAALLQLRKGNSCKLGSRVGKTARGELGGTPFTDGVQTKNSQTLNIRGFNNNVTDVLRAGDWVGIGDEGYKVQADANSDGTGDCTVTVFPTLRSAYADGLTIITANVTVEWYLVGNGFDWNEDVAHRFGLEFLLTEKVNI